MLILYSLVNMQCRAVLLCVPLVVHIFYICYELANSHNMEQSKKFENVHACLVSDTQVKLKQKLHLPA